MNMGARIGDRVRVEWANYSSIEGKLAEVNAGDWVLHCDNGEIYHVSDWVKATVLSRKWTDEEQRPVRNPAPTSDIPAEGKKYATEFFAIVAGFDQLMQNLTYEAFLSTFHQHGLDPKECCTAVANNLSLRPAHEWAKYGARLFAFAVRDVAQTHAKSERSTTKRWDDLSGFKSALPE